MSVVLDVTFQTHQDPPVHRVLKLYDRRFDSDQLIERKERNEAETLPVRASEFLDEPNQTEDLAKYEAALWQDCIEYFECETKAYQQLSDLQGTLVPRLYAHLVADAAYEINKRGVLMEDCAPRNVVVDSQSQTPRIVDLAQCNFRDEMVREWYESGWDEDEDWDPDVEYWEQVSGLGRDHCWDKAEKKGSSCSRTGSPWRLRGRGHRPNYILKFRLIPEHIPAHGALAVIPRRRVLLCSAPGPADGVWLDHDWIHLFQFAVQDPAYVWPVDVVAYAREMTAVDGNGGQTPASDPRGYLLQVVETVAGQVLGHQSWLWEPAPPSCRAEVAQYFLCLSRTGHPVGEDVDGFRGWNESKAAYHSQQPTELQRDRPKWYAARAIDGNPKGLSGGRVNVWDIDQMDLRLGACMARVSPAIIQPRTRAASGPPASELPAPSATRRGPWLCIGKWNGLEAGAAPRIEPCPRVSWKKRTGVGAKGGISPSWLKPGEQIRSWPETALPIRPHSAMAEGARRFAASIVAIYISWAEPCSASLSKTFIDANEPGKPGPLKAVHAEMSAMTALLNELHNHHDISDPRSSVAIERATDLPIKTCHDSVQMLEAELSKLSISPAHANTAPSKRQRLKQSVKWATGGETRVSDWVFRTTEWSDFLDGHRRSLWIHGIPGAGKTILCSNIAQRLRSLQNRRTGWVYYYCYFGRNQDETEPLLRWIIIQLCLQARNVPKKLSTAYRSGHQLGIVELVPILEAGLEAFDTAFITIDALDESMPYTNLLACLKLIMTEPRFNKVPTLDDESAISRYRAKASNHTRFRWAVCQVDILGRLKSPSHVRKALAELPETLDETYERIILAIPREYRDFARTALAMLAAQSELGDRIMTAEVLLAMVLRSMEVGADHFYDIYDIREFCGCLVTFVPGSSKTYQPDRERDYYSARSEDVTNVVMAHYTVKEFLYAERTAQKTEAHISSFALQEKAVIRQWANLVMEVAVSAQPSDRLISDNSMEDYCVATGRNVLQVWEDAIIYNSKVVDHCLDFLNPAASHHSRRSKDSILQLEWRSPPANPRLAALVECCIQRLWLLAPAALEDLNTQEIIETTFTIGIEKGRAIQKRSHPTRPKMIGISAPLLFANAALAKDLYQPFSSRSDDNARQEVANLLSTIVGWESLLLAATVEHNHACPAGSHLEWVILQGPELDAAPCRLTPLQAAVQLRDYEAVKLLLNSGADANAVGAAHGYSLAGSGLDESLAYDSPLRILKTARCAFRTEVAQRVGRESRRGDTTKGKLEGLLRDAGAREFTSREVD
ncbi:hypothetical protein CHGG_08385 [Chaetomium globosum CBS 148.51]|uniref:Nephrocystin 3-like N-terminal domain-containing protein n=1 Tax=Chaetomium globosum (strain ATCC 6205 / CBS 148.51 / DSM 1962 / NBRC 6347 / NRRL 1970) TaxID=306901 RepID=Q2GUG9_CHAGB|nr:uncharacterized protein CHGG_08385 [Chaetomium globosum CBS 148.51]EAQ84371.1 hypothetical protein CHGG_08385 [Chaetomium globosum CBS 148.51]